MQQVCSEQLVPWECKVYLGIEVKSPKNVVVTVEAQAINARHLAISIVIIQHKDEQRRAAGRHQAAETVPNLHNTQWEVQVCVLIQGVVSILCASKCC